MQHGRGGVPHGTLGKAILVFFALSYIGGSKAALLLATNAGEAHAHMWCVVTLGEAKHDCFSQ